MEQHHRMAVTASLVIIGTPHPINASAIILLDTLAEQPASASTVLISLILMYL
jgi:hypothetical protein